MKNTTIKDKIWACQGGWQLLLGVAEHDRLVIGVQDEGTETRILVSVEKHQLPRIIKVIKAIEMSASLEDVQTDILCKCGHLRSRHRSDIISGQWRYMCPKCQLRCPELNKR